MAVIPSKRLLSQWNVILTWGAEPVSKWIETALVLFGAAMVAWAMLQTHDVRIARSEQQIDRLESKIDAHLVAHEQQNKELMGIVTKIQLDVQTLVTRMNMDDEKDKRK